MDQEKPSKKQSNLVNLKRLQVVSLVAAGKSVPQIAAEMNLNSAHIYSWLSSHEGLSLLRESVDESNAILRRRLPQLVEQSLDALQKQLELGGPDQKAKAAKIILTVAARLPVCQCQQPKIIDHHH